MRAILLEDSAVVREDLPMPILGPGEALVRLLQAGICATDLELVRGYLPFRGTLGHEFVGVVVEAANDPAMVGPHVKPAIKQVGSYWMPMVAVGGYLVAFRSLGPRPKTVLRSRFLHQALKSWRRLLHLNVPRHRIVTEKAGAAGENSQPAN